MGELLLTQTEITPKGELFLGYKGLGGVHFPNWHHLFPTKILANTKYNEDKPIISEKIKDLEAKIQNSELSEYKTRKKITKRQVLQIYMPINEKKKLPGQFILGNYTKQARWQLGGAFAYVTLDDKIIEMLDNINEINSDFEELKKEIYSENKKATGTRILNQLDDLFLGENKTIKKIDKKYIEKRQQIQNKIIELESKLPEDFTFKYADRRIKIENTEQDYRKIKENFLKNRRTPNTQEIYSMKWAVLDIEIPRFKQNINEISWVAVKYYDAGIKSKIYTLRNTNKNEIAGNEIETFADEETRIKKHTSEINDFDPEIISAYNSKFDLIKLREKQFKIGKSRKGEKDPVYISTAKFFEQIKIHDRIVIDPMRWQKIARKYDPNAKLEMAAGFEKSIGYDEMEQLEEKAILGNVVAARTIAEYVASDVDKLFSIFFFDEFKQNLNDLTNVSNITGLSLEHLMHTTTAIINLQEKEYFKYFGTYRDKVFPYLKTKTAQKLEIKARNKVKKQIEKKFSDKKGFYKNVYKVSISTGKILEDLICNNCDELKKFYGYLNSIKDSERKIYLEQYADALAKWIITDYGAYIIKEKEFDKTFEKYKIEFDEFDVQSNMFYNSLSKSQKKKLKECKEFKISKLLEDYLKKNTITFKQFAELVNKKYAAKKHAMIFSYNYYIHPSTRFVSKTLPNISEMIHEKIENIKKELEQKNIKIIANEGHYLYVTGESEKTNITIADKMESLLVADKVYYKKNGFVSHLKKSDNTTYVHCKFESDLYNEMVEAILDGNYVLAKQKMQKADEKLMNGEVVVEDLYYHNKTKNTNKAFVIINGLKQKIEFVTCTENETMNDIYGRYYLQGKKKVYVLNEVKPDLKEYSQRIYKKGKELIDAANTKGKIIQQTLF